MKEKVQTDILNIISDEKISQLRDVYKKDWPYGSYVYNFLTNCINWKKKRLDRNIFTIMVPNEYEKDGTFICLMQFGCYDLLMFTLEKSCEKLHQCLINTKRIDWARDVFVFAIHDNHLSMIKKTLSHLNFDVQLRINSQAWRISVYEALQYATSCPQGLYMGLLDKNHIPTINEVWPHKYPGSDDYLWTMVEMNYGYGLFLKSNDELVGWVIKNHLGIIGILQVAENHSRKGYGSLLARIMAKALAEEGLEPFGFIVKSNEKSNAMFSKLGFSVLNGLHFFKNASA